MHVEFVKIIFWGYAQTITVLLKGGGCLSGPPEVYTQFMYGPYDIDH